MKLLAAEVVLIRIQFHQGPGSKIRPALVLADCGDEDSEFDLVFADWRAAGLNVPSVGRAHKLTVLAKSGHRTASCGLFKH